MPGGSARILPVGVPSLSKSDEHVVAGQAPFPESGPATTSGRRPGRNRSTGDDVRAVHSDVDEIGGGAQRARQVRPADHAICGPVRLQERDMSSHCQLRRRNSTATRIQPGTSRRKYASRASSTRQRGRQLDQQHRPLAAQLVPARRDPLQPGFRRVQLAGMGQAARRLDPTAPTLSAACPASCGNAAGRGQRQKLLFSSAVPKAAA